MATIYKKRGKWHIDYSINGKRKTRNTNLPSSPEFKKEALKIKSRVEYKILTMDQRVVKIKGLTFEEAYARFLEQQFQGKSEKHKGLAGLSYRQFIKIVNEKKNVKDITTVDLQKFIDWLRDNEKSNETIRTYLRYLKMFLNFMVEEDVIIKSPFKRNMTPKPKKRLIVTFTTPEVNSVLIEALNRDPKYYCILRMLLLTGQRPCDLLRLKYEDIDLKKKIIYIRISKTSKEILFPIYDELHDFIQTELYKHYRYEAGGMIFEDYNVETVGKRFRRIKKHLNITRANLDLKTFRKTFATHVATSGMDRSRVADLLGHDDDKTTKKYYADIHTDKLRQEMNKLFSES